MSLSAGANDVRHLAPGVYFVRLSTPTGNAMVRTVLLH
jgi:hypothetical protein